MTSLDRENAIIVARQTAQTARTGLTELPGSQIMDAIETGDDEPDGSGSSGPFVDDEQKTKDSRTQKSIAYSETGALQVFGMDSAPSQGVKFDPAITVEASSGARVSLLARVEDESGNSKIAYVSVNSKNGDDETGPQFVFLGKARLREQGLVFETWKVTLPKGCKVEAGEDIVIPVENCANDDVEQ